MRRFKVLAVFGAAALMLGACGNDTSGEVTSGSTTTEASAAGDTPQENDDEAAKKDDDAPKKNSGDRSAEAQAYVDSMTAAFEEDAGVDESFPVDQMECFVGDMVDGIGVDNLKEAGLTPESVTDDSADADIEALSEGDRKVVADSFTGCIDLEEIFIGSIEAESGGDELPKEMKECFAAIDWKVMEAEFAETIVSGDDGEDSAAMAPLMGCMMMGLGELETPATGSGAGG